MSAAQVVVTGLSSTPARRGGARLGGLPVRGWVGVAVIAAMAISSALVPLVSPYSSVDSDVGQRLLAPSADHWFGTDELGRDVFTRVFAAGRIDIGLSVVAVTVALVAGALIGAVAGMNRRLDALIMRLADTVQALPVYVFCIVVAFMMGPGAVAFLVATACVGWVAYARLIRARILTIRELDYAKAARTSGLGRTRVLLRHVLPNAIPQALLYAASDVVFMLLTLSSLSYLGVGITPPTAEWGAMIAGGQAYLRTAWWLALAPGVAILVLGGAFALLAESIDDRSRS